MKLDLSDLLSHISHLMTNYGEVIRFKAKNMRISIKRYEKESIEIIIQFVVVIIWR